MVEGENRFMIIPTSQVGLTIEPTWQAMAARGSMSNDRCRSNGPPQAVSGWRSISKACLIEYVSTKCLSSCTWKPVSTARSLRLAINPARSTTVKTGSFRCSHIYRLKVKVSDSSFD